MSEYADPTNAFLKSLEIGMRTAQLASSREYEEERTRYYSSLADEAEKNNTILDDTMIEWKDQPGRISLREAKTRASIEYDMGRSDLGAQQTRELKAKLDREGRGAEWSLYNDVITDLKDLASPEYSKHRNTAVFDQKMAVIMENVERLDSDYGRDAVQFLDNEYYSAQAAIAPVLESGDYSTILGGDYANELNVLFKDDRVGFVGKKYKDSKISGEIKDVRLTGNFIPADGGESLIAEAEYSIVTNPEADPDAHVVKKATGYLPDYKRGTISAEMEPIDAKSVSVSQIMDKVAGGRTLLTMTLDNPQMLIEGSKIANRRMGENYGVNVGLEEEIIKIVGESLMRQEDRTRLTLQDMVRETRAWDMSKQIPDLERKAVEQDKLLRTFKGVFPRMTTSLETDPDGRLKLKENQTLMQAILGTLPNESDWERTWRSMVRVPGASVQANEYVFPFNPSGTKREVIISEKTPRPEFLGILDTLYNPIKVDEWKKQMLEDLKRESGNNAATLEEIPDEYFVAEFHELITQRP